MSSTDGTTTDATDRDRLPSQVSSQVRPASGVQARVCPRAPAREAAQTPAAPTLGSFARAWAKGVRAEFPPPNLWSHARPSLRESWLYARHGGQAAAHGAGRRMCRGSAWLAVPLRAVALFTDWLAERPSRLLAAAVFYLVLAQIIPIAPAWLTC